MAEVSYRTGVLTPLTPDIGRVKSVCCVCVWGGGGWREGGVEGGTEEDGEGRERERVIREIEIEGERGSGEGREGD